MGHHWCLRIPKGCWVRITKTVSVVQQNEGGIGKSIHPPRPRDFLRPERMLHPPHICLVLRALPGQMEEELKKYARICGTFAEEPHSVLGTLLLYQILFEVFLLCPCSALQCNPTLITWTKITNLSAGHCAGSEGVVAKE